MIENRYIKKKLNIITDKINKKSGR